MCSMFSNVFDYKGPKTPPRKARWQQTSEGENCAKFYKLFQSAGICNYIEVEYRIIILHGATQTADNDHANSMCKSFVSRTSKVVSIMSFCESLCCRQHQWQPLLLNKYSAALQTMLFMKRQGLMYSVVKTECCKTLSNRLYSHVTFAYLAALVSKNDYILQYKPKPKISMSKSFP